MRRDRMDDTYEQEKRRTNFNSLFVLVIILVILLLTYLGQINAASFAWTGSGLTMTVADDTVYTVYYEDILSIDLVTSPDYGACLSGSDGFRQDYGTWENDLWGTYQLCVTSAAKEAIVLTLTDSIFVFNYESDKTTESLYEYLLELIAAE